MPLNKIIFTFNKGLTEEASFNGAKISFSPMEAHRGMAVIFEKIKARNKAVYEQVHSLKNYTLSLTPIPDSPNIALQIVSQKLIVKAQLTPETGAQLLTSIKVLPPEFTPYFQPGQDTISSNEEPGPGILATLFQRIRTLLSTLFSPKERPQPKPSLPATPAQPLTIPVSDQNHVTFDASVKHEPQPGPLISSPPATPVKARPEQLPLSHKDFFNPVDPNLLSLLRSQLALSVAPIPSPQGPEPIIPQTIATEPLQPSDFETLKNFFKVLFPNTRLNEKEFFGDYFFDRILPTNGDEPCKFDLETGRFEIIFKEEKQIVLEKLPEGEPRKSEDALKQLLGKTLHVNRVFTGRIDHDKATIEFDEGVLTANWVSWRKNWSADMLSITADHADPDYLIFKGKFGVTGNARILAQDFVDFLECNSPQPNKQ